MRQLLMVLEGGLGVVRLAATQQFAVAGVDVLVGAERIAALESFGAVGALKLPVGAVHQLVAIVERNIAEDHAAVLALEDFLHVRINYLLGRPR